MMKIPHAMLGTLLVSSIAVSQSSMHRVIPATHEHLEGNSRSAYPLEHEDVRWQMVIDKTAIAKTQALIAGLSFRPDGNGGTTQFQGKKLKVSIVFYEVTTTPSSMGTTFKSNIGGAKGFQVFKGTVVLPTTTPELPLPHTFSAKIPFPSLYTFKIGSKNLLIDWQETGSHRSLTWNADAVSYNTQSPSGLVNKIWEDTRCMNRRGDQASLSISATGQGVLGGPLQVTYTMKPSASGNLDLMVLGLGTSHRSWGQIKLPLDLAPFGYRSCRLAVDLPVLIPSLTNPVSLRIPNNNAFNGVPLYTQGLAIDSKASEMVPTWNAYQVVIQPNRLPVGAAQTVYATKPSTRGGVGFKSANHSFPVLRMDGRLFQ